MLKKILIFLPAILLFIAIPVSSLMAADDKLKPNTNAGEKWRMGYDEGGTYIDYKYNLRSYIKALMELGWIKPAQLPQDTSSEDARNLWEWLSDSAQSNYLTFVKDAYYSSDWNNDKRVAVRKKILSRLSVKKDIDLIIAMGTWAGQDLANNDHSVPVMVMSSSNPLQSNIIKSVEDSGFDHVIAKCDPHRYIRQLKLFHDIVNFKSLGVVYDNSESGRVYANLEDVKQVAAERGFDVVECHAAETDVTEEEAKDNVYACWTNIAPRIDALWITVHVGEQPKFMPEILEPVFKHKVATWTRRNSDQVAKGVLMSISRKDYDDLGRFYANATAMIFNGEKPRDLNQEFQEPLKIAINTETARKINYKIPPTVLKIADEVYDHIETGSFKAQ